MSTTDIYGRRTIELPPREVRKLIPELAGRIEQVEQLRRDAAATERRAAEARSALEQAEADDRQALADHARGKRKQKPTATTPKAGEQLAVTETTAAALRQAVADAERELSAAIEEHGAALTERLGDEIEQLRAQLEAALGRARAIEDQRMKARALVDWFREPRRYAPGKFGSKLLGLLQRNGEPFRLDLLFAELADLLAPEEPDVDGTETEAA